MNTMGTTNNNIIKMTRGDTYKFDFIIPDDIDGSPYILKGNDTVYFAVMEPNSSFDDALITKSTKDEISYDIFGNFYITIKSINTEHLLPGVYYYTIKLHQNHPNMTEGPSEPTMIDKVSTVINRTKFIIME